MPFKAVKGMVNRNRTRMIATKRFTKRGCSGSIGVVWPRKDLHLLSNNTFHDAPMIRP